MFDWRWDFTFQILPRLIVATGNTLRQREQLVGNAGGASSFIRACDESHIASDRTQQLSAVVCDQRAAIGAEPAAQHAHQAADMFAHDDVVDAEFAQLPVHVLDKQFGQQRAF